MACMACDHCGVSFNAEIPDGPSSVIRFGRILCTLCDTDFFPPCVVCSKKIMQDPMICGSAAWHKECLNCSTCSKPITDEKFGTHNGEPVCPNCSSPEKMAPTEPPPFASEVLALVDNPLALKHWKKALGDNAYLVEALEAIYARKRNVFDEERIQLLTDFETKFIGYPIIASAFWKPAPAKCAVPHILDDTERACLIKLGDGLFTNW